MNYKYILFDLDGTLSDSAPGITKSVSYALERFDIHEKSENLGFFVGPPLLDAFMSKYGMSKERAELAIKYFRERFTEKGIYENHPYDGVEELLSELCRNGKKLILATSKPEEFAKKILERYGFLKYFIFVGGASMDEKNRIHKNEVIGYCLEKCGITDTENCIMVGDRSHDVLGAMDYGIKTVGVLYGYGSRAELVDSGAIEVLKNPSELCRFLLK